MRGENCKRSRCFRGLRFAFPEIAFSLFFGLFSTLAQAEVGHGQRGIVATVHPLATEAGINALKKGGNAVDAAVAAALTLGVVDGHNSGLGGGCFLFIRLADGRFVAIDGRETAPAAATRDMYLREGKADTELSQTGALASGTPGALAAYNYAVTHYGRLKLKHLLLPAAKIAERGFVIGKGYAKCIEDTAEDVKPFPAARVLLLHDDGTPKAAGELLRQPDLARTYRAIARQGVNWFYFAPFAQATDAWMRDNRGLLRAEDFARYQIKFREPIRTTYRGYEIVGFSPPSSGGVHVAQILNILEHFDLRSMGAGSPEFIHVVAEAMKLAFADRAHWLGDPDFTPVPRGLVSKAYAAQLAKRIRLDHAEAVLGHGTPERASEDVFGRGPPPVFRSGATDHLPSNVASPFTMNRRLTGRVWSAPVLWRFQPAPTAQAKAPEDWRSPKPGGPSEVPRQGKNDLPTTAPIQHPASSIQHQAAATAEFATRAGHTTHFSTADAAGNWVACTATVNTSFGSKVVVPGTGVFLNNQMDDFSIQPGVTNYFGLLGSAANAVAPGKRPLSSMSPTIVLKDGQPILAIGAAGGPTIISQVLLTLVYTLDFGMDLEAALAAPRFHHQWKPDELKIEKKAGETVMRELERRGHKVVPVNSLGVAQAVAVAPTGKGFVGAHDPRVNGKAMGW